jgi:hypothetical protein
MSGPEDRELPEPDDRIAASAGLPDPDFDVDAWDRAIREINETDPDEYPTGWTPTVVPTLEDPPPVTVGNACKRCGELIPPTGRRGRQPAYHDECRPGAKHSGMTDKPQSEEPEVPTGKGAGTAGARPRATSASKREEELARVRRNAAFLTQMAAAGVLAIGGDNPVTVADALDIQSNADALAEALANVAKYEAWLRKLLGGAGGSDRGMAWVGLIMVSASIAVPILIRHEMMPAQLSGLVSASQMAAQVANTAS